MAVAAKDATNLGVVSGCSKAPKTTVNFSGIDFVIVSLRAMCSTEVSLKRISSMYQPRHIHYVTGHPAECNVLSTLMNNDTRFSCLNEDDVFPHISTASLKSDCHALARDTKKTFGWHMQQFVKLGVARHLDKLSDRFVVFDADNILIYPFSMISNTGKVFLPFKPEAAKMNYDIFYNKTLGLKLTKRNYVIGHMLMERSVVREILDAIDSKWNDTFPASICKVAMKYDLSKVNTHFSEYYFYASWLKEKHPETIASEYYWYPDRNPSMYQEKAWNGDCCVKEEMLCNSFRSRRDFYVIIEEHKFRYRDKVCDDGWNLGVTRPSM